MILEFTKLYMPSHEASVFDLDNANAEMEAYSAMFKERPLDRDIAEKFRSTRERFFRAADIACDARLREVNTALYERGRI